MIHSMTGFGKAEAKSETRKVSIEIRSLNSKQADVNLRLPNELRHVEMDVRKKVTNELLRGKLDVSISIEELSNRLHVQFNRDVFEDYWAEIQEVSCSSQIPHPSDPFRLIMSLPGTTSVPTPSEEETRSIEELLHTALDQAIQHLKEFRAQEGEALKAAFEDNIQAISDLLEQTKPYEEQRIVEVRQRLEDGLKKYVEVDYDTNRLEQEMIYYIEKLDVNEEKTRLANHLHYFRETMELPNPGQGRKLGFIAQEMGREINTLGSKSNHAALQKIVVKMKDHLEQIKEQVLNVL